MITPSKELLSAVLSIKNIQTIYEPDNGRLAFSYIKENEELDYFINLYELAHKVKEWAKDRGYYLETRYISTFNQYRCVVYYESGTMEFAEPTATQHKDTEPEAIFEAGEWVLQKLKSR